MKPSVVIDSNDTETLQAAKKKKKKKIGTKSSPASFFPRLLELYKD